MAGKVKSLIFRFFKSFLFVVKFITNYISKNISIVIFDYLILL